MRLAGFKTFLVHDGYRTFVFLKLYTEDGLAGVGEGSVEWNELAVEACLRQTCARLIGTNPFDTEALWERLYRDSYWRNDLIINSAISAIDQACWDLKGKKLGVPVHALLGGKRRARLRAYANAWYFGCSTPEEFARAARTVVADGFTALKWDPFGDADMTMSAAAMRAAAENVRAVRDTVGPDVDICIEVHGRLSPAWAIEMARRLQPFQPFFYEEPIPAENITELARVARAIDIPVATGERLCTKFLFRELLAQQAVDIIQPDLCHAGGLTEVKKIAALAEASYVQVAPHNASGPIGTRGGRPARRLHPQLPDPGVLRHASPVDRRGRPRGAARGERRDRRPRPARARRGAGRGRRARAPVQGELGGEDALQHELAHGPPEQGDPRFLTARRGDAIRAPRDTGVPCCRTCGSDSVGPPPGPGRPAYRRLEIGR